MIITPKDNLNDSISQQARDNLNLFLAKRMDKINRKLVEIQMQQQKQNEAK